MYSITKFLSNTEISFFYKRVWSLIYIYIYIFSIYFFLNHE